MRIMILIIMIVMKMMITIIRRIRNMMTAMSVYACLLACLSYVLCVRAKGAILFDFLRVGSFGFSVAPKWTRRLPCASLVLARCVSLYLYIVNLYPTNQITIAKTHTTS